MRSHVYSFHNGNDFVNGHVFLTRGRSLSSCWVSVPPPTPPSCSMPRHSLRPSWSPAQNMLNMENRWCIQTLLYANCNEVRSTVKTKQSYETLNLEQDYLPTPQISTHNSSRVNLRPCMIRKLQKAILYLHARPWKKIKSFSWMCSLKYTETIVNFNLRHRLGC